MALVGMHSKSLSAYSHGCSPAVQVTFAASQLQQIQEKAVFDARHADICKPNTIDVAVLHPLQFDVDVVVYGVMLISWANCRLHLTSTTA